MPAAVAFRRRRVDSARLHDLRSEAGLSQELLAYRSRLCLRTVRLAEQGVASRRTIEAVASVLRVPAESLIAPELPPPPPRQEATAP